MKCSDLANSHMAMFFTQNHVGMPYIDVIKLLRVIRHYLCQLIKYVYQIIRGLNFLQMHLVCSL
jgi:hypothetical protein